MRKDIEVPSVLWQHSLFKDAVEAPSIAADDIAFSVCEKKIRLIKNMQGIFIIILLRVKRVIFFKK